nr:serine/arginine repetitive matrix protein 1 isoform X5 [Ipomoea batatas]
MSGGGVVGEAKRGRGVCELMHERGSGLWESGKDWRMNTNALHGCVFSSDSAAIFLCCNGGWLFVDSIVDGGIKISDVDISRDQIRILLWNHLQSFTLGVPPMPSAEKVYADKSGSRGRNSDVDISRDQIRILLWNHLQSFTLGVPPMPSAEKVYADKNGSRGRNRSDRDEVYANNYHTQRMLSIL